ncbi:TPA: hypothetical protein ACVTFU_002112 [Salmonella bongori]
MSVREPPFIAIALILNQVIDVGKLMGALGGDSGPDLSFVAYSRDQQRITDSFLDDH